MPSLELFDDPIPTLSLRAGETLFKTGDPGDCMYLVKEGEVEIQIADRSIGVFGPGYIFGEMALISDEPRSATVQAHSDCRLLAIDEERFLFLVQTTPYFSLRVMRVLADRLRSTDKTRPPDP